MSLLLSPHALALRRDAISGPLAPLADSLDADLTRAMDLRPSPPPKARLTRRGGRCTRDGTLLAFDPAMPHEHRCPRCGSLYEGSDHDGWWALGMQLWLAERTVHAATLHALRGDPSRARWAAEVLHELADTYLRYPNRDNVLGPSRPFFSTYLESLWLLHVCIAVDLLEGGGADGARWVESAAMRDLLIAPSAELIASYDEGDSNRQVWNSAALIAANRLLNRPEEAARAAEGTHGVLHHLSHGLLADGSWYEGENYHQFAQRGLWCGIALYEGMGGELPHESERRWRLAAVTPFLTALPDFTMPARRDSQWRVSLRQWRFAEMAELGAARDPDERRLHAALATMYAPDTAPGDTGRFFSTGEAERNVPPVRLSRSDLGWKSLLFALRHPVIEQGESPGTVLLTEQGYAVVRRDDERVYVALDYGSSGGGHGHPDRLGIVVQQEAIRWFDDPGTGSYTDPSLHWYRSSLAHNAPLVDGRRQRPVRGRLMAFHASNGATLVDARADGLAPSAGMRRALCVMPDYLVDELTWDSEAISFVDLPMHVDASVDGVDAWLAGDPAPRAEPDAGFEFLSEMESANTVASVQALTANAADGLLRGWIAAGEGASYWRALAPGAPGEDRSRMLLLRMPRTSGRMVAVWCWNDSIADVSVGTPDGDAHTQDAHMGASIVVHRTDGSRHLHRRSAEGWLVEVQSARTKETILLGSGSGSRDDTGPDEYEPAEAASAMAPSTTPFRIPRLPNDSWGGPNLPLDTAAAAFELGREHWRGSEQDWEEAGVPRARVRMAAIGDRLAVEVDVRKETLVFAPAADENPLDNEHPDINSDGVQLHIGAAGQEGPGFAWLLVPELEEGRVRINARTPAALATVVDAHWWLNRAGWSLRVDVPLAAIDPDACGRFSLDVLVNEIPPGRERRRGQLVLSGARGERVWLRGDRQDISRLLPMELHA